MKPSSESTSLRTKPIFLYGSLIRTGYSSALKLMLSSVLWLFIVFTFVSSSYAAGPVLETKQDFIDFYNRVQGSGVYKYFSYRTPNLDPESESIKFVSDEEFRTLLKKNPEWIRVGSGWKALLYPDLGIALSAYRNMMENGTLLNFVSPATAKVWKGADSRIAALRDPNALFEHFKTTSGGLPWEFPVPEENVYSKLGRDEKLALSNFFRVLACMRLEPLSAQKCAKAIDGIAKFMAPASDIAALPLWKKVMSDPIYTDVASRASLKIAEKIRLLEKSLTLSPESFFAGDLLDDVISAGRDAGLNVTKSIEVAWDILGAYGTRGANVGLLLPYAKSPQAGKLILALETLSHGLAVLDSAMAGSGHLYSIPKSISTVANYTKPYHFWMSAYLSRKFSQEVGGRRASMAATALAEIAYQLLSTTVGRKEMLESIAREGEFGIAALKTKIDLGFGFAGAEFGIVYKSEIPAKAINVDLAVKAMVEYRPNVLRRGFDALVFEMISINPKLKSYMEWVERIHPFTGYSSIRTQSCTALTKSVKKE